MLEYRGAHLICVASPMQWMPEFRDQCTYRQEQSKWVTVLLEKIIDRAGHPFQLFDIGANKGHLTDSAICAVHNYNYIMHAFEPNPACYNFLKDKYQNNHKIKIYPDVVGEIDSRNVAFNYSIQNSSLSYLRHSPVKHKISMITDWQTIIKKQVAIDTVIDRNVNTVFLKIDAEGHDFFVLKGCQWVLQNHRPFVLFEFSGLQNCEDYGYSPREWYDFFRSNNYDLVAPMGGHDVKFILSHFHLHQPNFLDILAVPIEKKYILQ